MTLIGDADILAGTGVHSQVPVTVQARNHGMDTFAVLVTTMEDTIPMVVILVGTSQRAMREQFITTVPVSPRCKNFAYNAHLNLFG